MDDSGLILEMLRDMSKRIAKLEIEVEQLRSKGENIASVSEEKLSYEEKPQQRDKTRYMFQGNVYLKNKLVLAIVKDYVANHSSITCDELKAQFDKSLQGSIGVVECEDIAKKRKDYQVRFFDKENEILHLADGNMMVCSQWGILNIPNFIKRATQLGYKIERI